MYRLLFLTLLSTASATAAEVADPMIFKDGFEAEVIQPLFPVVAGRFQLPDSPIKTQLNWLLDELAVGQTTSEAEVNEHFDAAWLGSINAAATVSFINAIRDSYPDAYIADLITVTPIDMVATIRSPANASVGFFVLKARFTGTKRINSLGVNNFNHNSTVFIEDQTATMSQMADKFMMISGTSGLLVAQIDETDTCIPIEARNENTLRATASVFKTWVLGGVARAMSNGQVTLNETVNLVAGEVAPGGSINIEPSGTPFSVIDLARLMLGISDNTATDLLHERVGRPVIDEWVSLSGVANPDVLRPLLKINEQFHVFSSLPRVDADAYVDGTEPYQYGFVPTLEALGPLVSGPYLWTDLLVDGTWRASPMDVCANFAALRGFNGDAKILVNEALGASVAQPNVRGDWDRVWYKGGSLAQATNQYNVYTHAWMVERNGERPLVLVAMANSASGGISGLNNVNEVTDIYDIQSITGRILELMESL